MNSLEKMGETHLILKSCERYLILKFLREAIKTISLSNFFVATFASWQNFQLRDTKRDLKFQHQGYKWLFDDKNNKNDVIEISIDK